jgi:hypothetical protein
MLETVLRTPDERFVNLPGYPFEPHYLDVDGARMHYVDEGPFSDSGFDSRGQSREASRLACVPSFDVRPCM